VTDPGTQQTAIRSAKPTSFRELPPRETGGIENRQGVEFQDHVAAGYCIQMLQSAVVDEVWCETHDDVVIVWNEGTGDIPEYVQVKGSEFNQLWSPALLCERKNGKAGTSILERSLQNDRASEPALFRVVSYRQINKDLAPLREPRDLAGRSSTSDACKALIATLNSKVGNLKSPNGNGLDYWVGRCFWETLPDSADLERMNIFELLRVFETQGFLPAPDSAREAYTRLLRKVQEAAFAPASERHKKIIGRQQLLEWLASVVAETKPSSAAGQRARAKLERAGVDEAGIAAAQENRLFYRTEVLKSQYLSLRDRTLAESEVTAALQEVRARLDAGELSDTGVEFHARCLSTLRAIQTVLLTSTPTPLAFLQGRMYDLTDRCLHRFTRAEP
jgi:hypothetical protein